MLRQLGESAGLGDLGGMFAFDDKEFWKGAVVGAAAVLLLTNENVRDTLMGGISKATSAVKPGSGTETPTAEESKDNSEES